MSENLTLYNAVRVVPAEAQKPITGGRLKNMTDINPMWRIKMLTDQFGVCGAGWKYVIKDKQFLTGGKDEIAVFVDIDLYYRVVDGLDEPVWSEPIPGTGGSMFVENQKNGPYVNDECIKMALTDAISVACKALGFGADIYWQKDRTKYNGNTEPLLVHLDTLKTIADRADQIGMSKEELRIMMKELYGVTDSRKLTVEQAAQLDSKLIERLEENDA